MAMHGIYNPLTLIQQKLKGIWQNMGFLAVSWQVGIVRIHSNFQLIRLELKNSRITVSELELILRKDVTAAARPLESAEEVAAKFGGAARVVIL